jgi:hypothetical protein
MRSDPPPNPRQGMTPGGIVPQGRGLNQRNAIVGGLLFHRTQRAAMWELGHQHVRERMGNMTSPATTRTSRPAPTVRPAVRGT